jgi:hypothetical protein
MLDLHYISILPDSSYWNLLPNFTFDRIYLRDSNDNVRTKSFGIMLIGCPTLRVVFLKLLKVLHLWRLYSGCFGVNNCTCHISVRTVFNGPRLISCCTLPPFYSVEISGPQYKIFSRGPIALLCSRPPWGLLNDKGIDIKLRTFKM